MIDIGRQKDMEKLMLIINDEAQSLLNRRQAHRIMQSIKRKMSDTYITKHRLRLIAATIANDTSEVEKISERIQDYERKHYIKK